MASGIFAVLDDIAALMDDVAIASKIATQKTAGILGDDLAVNAEKATGFVASREIPVLIAISKGSFINKLIIVPLAFALNLIYPPAIIWILILGGVYLAYEGIEKVFHYVAHLSNKKTIETVPIQNDPIDEKAKIKSAITTDFILSIEIVIIALGTVLGKPLPVQIITVLIVAVLATIGVYGLVALVVKLDDLGYWIIRKSPRMTSLGQILIRSLPIIIKIFSIVGTAALLVVSGGIFIHNIDALHHWLEPLPVILREAIMGCGVGLVAFGLFEGVKKLNSYFKK